MGKLVLDKYYTPVELANHCIDKVLDMIGENNISEVIEPSIGNGSFTHHKTMLVHFGYDIAPECNNIYSDTKVITGDFLEQDIKYLEGRLIIGNPPYGRTMYLAQKFFKKAIQIGDYVAFILPISQLNNTSSLYEFDLVYSEDLGVQNYSGRKLHCCFNIYRRPVNSDFNNRQRNKLKSIKIYRQDKADYKLLPYDIRMCYWGNGTCGKILEQDENYSAEYKIIVDVQDKLKKQEIVEFIKNFDWRNYVNCIAMKKIQQFHIINVLKNHFEWLE